MNVSRVAAIILRHLVPALEAARIQLERQAADEAAAAAGRPSTCVFDLRGAAEYLRTSTSTVHREIAAGRLPCKRLGQRVYVISERALLAWIEGGDGVATGRPVLTGGREGATA